jgi:hypothetical protein
MHVCNAFRFAVNTNGALSYTCDRAWDTHSDKLCTMWNINGTEAHVRMYSNKQVRVGIYASICMRVCVFA